MFPVISLLDACLNDKKIELVDKYKLPARDIFSMMANSALSTLLFCCGHIETYKEAMEFTEIFHVSLRKELSELFKNKEK